MFQVVLAVVAVYLVYLVARHLMGGGLGIGGGSGGFKCATCKSCGKLFDDGVLCRFQGRETFKNETHIRNCIDHEKR